MEKILNEDNLINLAALLVHASKIDDSYTVDEKKLVSKFIENFVKTPDRVKEILLEAEKKEADSNQLLNYTKIIKKNSLEFKTIVVKELWKIILSNNFIDEFESSLMRRICGLIYFPDHQSNKIRNEIKENLK
tara:strand:+ start:452 stop:850 length:399 start_codon:yes stop_codon:yes gene_type:complete